jgi:hypothetical protein
VGYTTDDSSLSNVGNGTNRFPNGGAKFAPLTTTDAEVHRVGTGDEDEEGAPRAGYPRPYPSYGTAPVDESSSGFACVGYQVGTSATDPQIQEWIKENIRADNIAQDGRSVTAALIQLLKSGTPPVTKLTTNKRRLLRLSRFAITGSPRNRR